MAKKAKLKGSFGSLIDTLTQRFDPLQPEDVVALWTTILMRCAAIARDTDRWARLPDEDDRYDAVIQALDRATRALVNADFGEPDQVRAALLLASEALDGLEALLAD